MIKIEAIIRPERINGVPHVLEEVGCRGFHFQNVTGQGQQLGVEVFTGRGGQTVTRAALSKTLVVTVVPDEMQETTIDAIVGAARSPDGGQIGEGKIMVSHITDVVRVRTAKRGEAAI